MAALLPSCSSELILCVWLQGSFVLSILLSFILHISALSAFFPKVLLAVAAAPAVQQSAAAIVVILSRYGRGLSRVVGAEATALPKK